MTLVKDLSFLSDEKRVLELDKVIEWNKVGQVLERVAGSIIGYPMYCHFDDTINVTIEVSPDKVKQHNIFMQKKFGELLSDLIKLLEGQLGESIIINENLPLPGFHLFQCPPGKLPIKNFHYDNSKKFLAQYDSKMQSADAMNFYSFTCLLSHDEQLDVGLEYVPKALESENDLNAFRLPFEKLSLISKVHPYPTGKLCLHEKIIIHNIYAHNHSQKILPRVTLQGHLIGTSKGLVLYW